MPETEQNEKLAFRQRVRRRLATEIALARTVLFMSGKLEGEMPLPIGIELEMHVWGYHKDASPYVICRNAGYEYTCECVEAEQDSADEVQMRFVVRQVRPI